MSALILLLWISGARAQDDPPTSDVEAIEGVVESDVVDLVDTPDQITPTTEEPLAIEPATLSVRPPYWYEPLTDLFWTPGHVLAWAGVIGADHIDAAALTTWIGAVAAFMHRIWLALWAVVAPIYARMRTALGFSQRATSGGAALSRVTGLDEADQEYLRALVKKESDAYAATVRTEAELLRQQLLTEMEKTRTAVKISEHVLGVSLNAAGHPHEGP